jgi:hypothetical protein
MRWEEAWGWLLLLRLLLLLCRVTREKASARCWGVIILQFCSRSCFERWMGWINRVDLMGDLFIVCVINQSLLKYIASSLLHLLLPVRFVSD